MVDRGRAAAWLERCRDTAASRLRGVPALQGFTALELLPIPLWTWMALIWFLFVVPAIGLRGFHYEEGTVVALARGALEDGRWIVPSHYGYRFIERPALMSWLVAGLGEIFGINQWTARLPAVLSLLAGAALVFGLVRTRATALAALFAAICLLASPMILQKVITAEPDVMVSVLLFAAFVIWWNGHAAGQVTLLRWLAIGLVLAAAAVTKGPHPIAYFTLGVGTFLLLHRRWADLPGFVLAHAIAGAVLLGWYIAVYQPGDLIIWGAHSRMGVSGFAPIHWAEDVIRFAIQFALELLPALLLAVPCAIALFRTGLRKGDDLIVALVLYALCTTLVVALWPGARTRYAMPSILPLAALAGLMFDRFRAERPALLNLASLIMACIVVYQITLSWLVMPLLPDLVQNSRIAGRTIADVIETQPATLYAVRGDLNNNVLAYVPSRVRDIPIEELFSVPAPAWVMISAEWAAQVQAQMQTRRPDLRVTLRAVLHEDRLSYLIDLREK